MSSDMELQVTIHFDGKQPKAITVANTLEGFKNTTVSVLKKMFKKELPADVGEMQFIHQNKTLEDQKTLGFYNIQHESQILAVMKMPGGVALKPYIRTYK